MNNTTIKNIKPLGFPWETQDPFLFCAYHKDNYPKGNDNMRFDTPPKDRNIGQDFVKKDGFRMYHGDTVPGFPFHPHRGFETITIAKEGFVDHSDSLGASGRFGNGDVQWMTAGKGIQHSEMFPLLNKTERNPIEMFQIWLNLPKSSKFVEPHFAMLWENTIPILKEKDKNNKKIEVNIIAGELKGIKAPNPPPDSWAKNPDNEVGVWTIKLDANAIWVLPKAKNDIKRTLYFYSGNTMKIEEISVAESNSIEVVANKDILLEAGDKECLLLVLQGKPIHEPVVQQGPFVMNTHQEIQEAILDYQKTQFGGWPWSSRDPVHDKNKGRFAIYANGKEENKN